MKHKDNFKQHKWKWIVYPTQNSSFTSSQQETYDKTQIWKLKNVNGVKSTSVDGVTLDRLWVIYIRAYHQKC
jgi:hypothetical protein